MKKIVNCYGVTHDANKISVQGVSTLLNHARWVIARDPEVFYLVGMTMDLYLLISRLWLGYSMVMGGQSILRFFSAQELRDFFENWFGNELGFPAPLVMAFVAKGTEFVGGILVGLGFCTRIAASLIAIVMFVATVVANIDYTGTEGFIRQDGTVTISCLLFAILMVINGGGAFSVDRMFFKQKFKYI